MGTFPSCTQDLLKHTPSSHPDHPLLQDALRISQNFLSSINEETAPRRQSTAAKKGEVSLRNGSTELLIKGLKSSANALYYS